MGLLWGEWPEGRAKANLRKSLTNLRKIVGAHLVIRRDSVDIDEDNPPWVDVVQFERGLGEDRLRHMEMYLADRLDILYTFSHLPPDTQRRVRDELIEEYRSGPLLATWLVGFVLSRPPFDDRRVRRAFALATDRETLANVVNRGMVSPASGGFLSPARAAFTEGIALPYDPDERAGCWRRRGTRGGGDCRRSGW